MKVKATFTGANYANGRIVGTFHFAAPDVMVHEDGSVTITADLEDIEQRKLKLGKQCEWTRIRPCEGE
jgi:hypothetical protein